ncbi:MAG: hypothetical protein A2Z18_08040 [Armatimonadetes bacterium RBG_16_58_9]|nr:MAG: hypothetical protein A2Z18_08040 [Armatimonadetes bacterium RBG_16_58_9]
MDYLNAPISFKLRKTLCYCRLYGPRRTLAKIRGQIHMRKVYEHLPRAGGTPRTGQTVGIIGCGNYAYSTIAHFLDSNAGKVIRGVMDTDLNRAASLFEEYKAAYYTDDADKLIGDDGIELIYIASNHASHAEYAIAALRADKNVCIEKPHVVSEDQLARLTGAMRESSGRVFLGFNRRRSRFGSIITETLAGEEGPGMYSWFVVGHQIGPDHWYMRPEEGGRVLGNLCHWTDFTLGLFGSDAYPIEINPTSAGRSDCDVAVTYTCADGTIAVITFSEKGHAFEGIRERFCAHKGDCLLEMTDFQVLKVERQGRAKVHKALFRDQGHQASIVSCYDAVRRSLPYAREAQTAYVWDTAMLFLKTKEALESDSRVLVYPYPAGCEQ